MENCFKKLLKKPLYFFSCPTRSWLGMKIT